MLRITSGRTLKIEEYLCACCMDWQKAFDVVKWISLMQNLKETRIDWRERRLYLHESECYITTRSKEGKKGEESKRS
jgi:hypothetical protein